MTRIALVSGADANYYPLLQEWIHSVRRFPESQNVDICVIDAGLTPEQVKELKSQVAHVINPDWPTNLPASKIKGQEYLKACVCRPFIPKLFPSYDIYMWMDSDTWVQNWDSVALFLRGATEKKDSITITNGADRHYQRQVRIKWLWRWPYRVASFYFSNGCKAFGFKTAKQLSSQYVLSAGCFALRGDAPHWKRWQELAIIAMKKGKLYPAEQLSLGVLVHLEGYKVELLPAYTHWLFGTKPLWDSAKKQFIEPFLPHQPLGVLHLVGVGNARLDKTVKITYPTTDGGTIDLNCRYPHFDGGSVAPPKRL